MTTTTIINTTNNITTTTTTVSTTNDITTVTTTTGYVRAGGGLVDDGNEGGQIDNDDELRLHQLYNLHDDGLDKTLIHTRPSTAVLTNVVGVELLVVTRGMGNEVELFEYLLGTHVEKPK